MPALRSLVVSFKLESQTASDGSRDYTKEKC